MADSPTITGPHDAARESSAPRAQPFRWRAVLVGLAGLALVLTAFSYWLKPKDAERPKSSSGAPVRTGEVTRRDMAVIERSTGTVVAQTYVQVAPLVTGELKQQHFRDGEFVRKGDLLFEIDPAPYQAAVAQARAVYEKDQAQLKNAQLDRERFETLFQQDSTSQQLRDTAIADAATQAAMVAADKAALDTALLNLKYTQIRSPIDGKTGATLLQPGNIVGAQALSQTGLVTIAQMRPIKVSFTLPQTDLPRVQAQQKIGALRAELDVPGVGGASYTAPVDFVSNSVNTQSGTIELRATFSNDDLTLVPGQLVHVVVVLGELSGALVLPRNAINDSPAGPYVYAVEKNKAVVKPVTVLFDDGTDAAVTGELDSGDEVITEGQLRVDAGSEVHVLGRSVPPPKLASDRIHPAQ